MTVQEFAELEQRAKLGDPQVVISFLLAYIKRVEEEALKKTPGSQGPQGAQGPPGEPAPQMDIVGDHGLYAHRANFNGRSEVRIGIYGTRRSLTRTTPLSDSPTPADLIRKVQELIGLHEELLAALRDRELIY